MKNLTEKELKKISGGFSITTTVIISALIAFLVGVIEGIVSPNPCGGE